MDDDLPRNRLAEAFRRSSRNPQHLAFLALPVVESLIREAKAEAWDEGYAAGCDDGHDHAKGLAAGRDNPYRD